jgi:two-component system, chemotaxis family, sensor kinase CheA
MERWSLQEKAQKSKKLRETYIMRNTYIVIIDDEKIVADTIVDLIKENNKIHCTPKYFENPTQALEFVYKNYKRISLILSDYKMPQMSGLDFKKNLSEQARQIPFLLITGFFSKELATEAMDGGARGVLEKPFDTDDLIGKLIKYSSERLTFLDDEFEMTDGFIEESRPMLDDIEGLILQLDGDGDKSIPLKTYFRLLHTIKGTAACIGLSKLAEFTHEYENLITALSDKKLELNQHVVTTLLLGFDFLKKIIDDVENFYTDEFCDVASLIRQFLENENQLAQFDELANPPGSQVAALKNTSGAIEQNQNSDQEKLSVSLRSLDQFMETSGEMTVLKGALFKTIDSLEKRYRGDRDFEHLTDLLDSMHKVSSGLQNQIMELRKVPLSNVFRPFKRLIRDLSTTLGKDVSMSIEGEELLVDSNIAKLWSNTLIHLLRNSLDHGIELPEERIKKGKEPQGKIDVKAYEQGEYCYIVIQDDGKGLNREVLVNKAEEKGLYTHEVLSLMSDTEVFELIFDSGFSTAAVVSDVSGRGVGMDMVRSSVIALGGDVSITSQLNKGTQFVLKVPIPKSVMIISALLVEVNQQNYLLPMDEIKELIIIEEENKYSKIIHFDESKLLEHHGKLYPLVPLHELQNDDQVDLAKRPVSIVIVKAKLKDFAILVDHIHEFEEVVIRDLSQSVQDLNLYKGASLIGNGAPALIFNVEGVGQKFALNIDVQQKNAKSLERENILLHKRDYSSSEFLLFDCYKTEKFAVPLDQVNRIERVQASTISYSGNMPVFYYRNVITPIILPTFSLGHEGFRSLLKREHFELQLIIFSRGNHLYALFVEEVLDIFECQEEIETGITDTAGIMGCLYFQDRTISVIDLDSIVSDMKKITESIDDLQVENLRVAA